MSESVVVVGVGMTSAVGLSARETAASVRAGAARFTATDFRDRYFERLTLAEVPDDGLVPLAEGAAALGPFPAREARMLRLATTPLRECTSVVAGPTRPPLGLCVALPETETRLPLDTKRFLNALAVQSGGVFDPAASDASHVGRAGGLIAVGQGVLTIATGRAEFVIAGGVDTFRDLYVLGTLELERRVKSEVNSDGFIPGEGAAFLLLASARAAAARGLRPLARVSQVGLGFEAGHLYSEQPYKGEGLANALAQLVAGGAVEAPIAEVYSSMNGESHWAKEWGVGLIRNKAAFHEPHGVHHPADCFGDVGAACGPLMAGLAALGIQAGYRRSPALVYSSSDRGARAAVVVGAPPH